MSEKKSGGFSEWYNRPPIQHAVGVVYSLGASVVIIGALFKILHLPGASIVLGIGMVTEAFLFALSALEKPYKSYEWSKIFDFGDDQKVQLAGGVGGNGFAAGSGKALGVNYTESISDEDVVSLSDGIKNLTNTAKQLSTIGASVKSSDEFAKTVEQATKAAGEYTNIQGTLNSATQKLSSSYEKVGSNVDKIGGEMETVGQNTKVYSEKVEGINKSLSSINTVYELHLKNVQAQSEGLSGQSDRLRVVSQDIDAMAESLQKARAASESVAKDAERYKEGTNKLAQQVADLNNVYGNMLNALS